jgi:hypothetical protein
MTVYVINEKDNTYPIIVSTTFHKAKELLDQFLNVKNNDIIYLGFTNYVYEEYDESYKGYYSYDIKYKIDDDYTKYDFKLYKLNLNEI